MTTPPSYKTAVSLGERAFAGYCAATGYDGPGWDALDPAQQAGWHAAAAAADHAVTWAPHRRWMSYVVAGGESQGVSTWCAGGWPPRAADVAAARVQLAIPDTGVLVLIGPDGIRLDGADQITKDTLLLAKAGEETWPELREAP